MSSNDLHFNLFVKKDWYDKLPNIFKDKMKTQFINDLNENLTIPQNTEDDIEFELYKKLDKNYDHADRIVRFYRNEKRKDGISEHYLKEKFIQNLPNIKDLFQVYDEYIKKFKQNKFKTIEIENNQGKKSKQIQLMILIK